MSCLRKIFLINLSGDLRYHGTNMWGVNDFDTATKTEDKPIKPIVFRKHCSHQNPPIFIFNRFFAKPIGDNRLHFFRKHQFQSNQLACRWPFLIKKSLFFGNGSWVKRQVQYLKFTNPGEFKKTKILTQMTKSIKIPVLPFQQ